MVTGLVILLGIPPQADNIRDWIVWSAAIVGGLVAIGVGIYKIAMWLRGVVREGILDVLAPDFAAINDKMDALKAANDAQHSEVGSQLADLRDDLTADRALLAEHMADAADSTHRLQELAEAVNLHITELRDDLTDPGLPPAPKPPTVPRPRFGF